MPPAREIIRREVAACGPIPFARFMELALYCPESGYYEQITNSPGRAGDFFTSVSVGPLFGELLGFQFARWLGDGLETGAGAGPESGARVLEAGAHDGRLAADILQWLSAQRPALFERLEYWILEPSERRRRWQAATLSAFPGKVRWFAGWKEVPPGFVGMIFSNEFLDALPVHRLGWDAAAGDWFEWFVTEEEGSLSWERGPRTVPLPGHWREFLPDLARLLPDGFTTEVAPAAADWWAQAAAVLKRGRLLTFDYGLNGGEFFLPQRAGGTLRAYYRHRASGDVLARPGGQDLTAQVDFTALERAGLAVGLRTDALCSQGRFLTGIAAAAWEAGSNFGEWTAGRGRQFLSLTHPEHLGRAHRVLVQGR